MKILVPLLAAAALLAQPAVAGQSPNHPEEMYPDNIPPLVTPDGPYVEMIKQVQQKLHEAGFDAGPVNGDFGVKTQAALGQYQLSQLLPASGALDDSTLKALGIEQAAQEQD